MFDLVSKKSLTDSFLSSELFEIIKMNFQNFIKQQAFVEKQKTSISLDINDTYNK